jgi:hypothetical protein
MTFQILCVLRGLCGKQVLPGFGLPGERFAVLNQRKRFLARRSAGAVAALDGFAPQQAADDLWSARMGSHHGGKDTALPATRLEETAKPILTKLFIADVDGIVRIEPRLSCLYAQHDVATFNILRDRNLGRPLRLIACRGYRYGHNIRGLIKPIEDAIGTDNRRVANVNIGGVLAGGGPSCKLQAGVGALDLI